MGLALGKARYSRVLAGQGGREFRCGRPAPLSLVEKIKIIARETADGTTVPMIVNEEGLPEVEGQESTRFELCDSVVQMGRFFPSLRSADLERERDEFLDRILYSGGYIPMTLAPLRREEKRAAADAMSAMLLTRLGAIEAEALIEGRKTLQDLGLQDRLESVVQETIGRPLDRTAFTSREGPIPMRTVEHRSA